MTEGRGKSDAVQDHAQTHSAKERVTTIASSGGEEAEADLKEGEAYSGNDGQPRVQ